MTWGNKADIAWRPSSICVTPHPVPMLSPTPPPALRRRGCTVPGEGWSPAETEHFGEARRRRRTVVRRRVRCSSPFASERTGTRTGCVSTGVGSWSGIALLVECVAIQRRVIAYEPGAFWRAIAHRQYQPHHHDGARYHDDGCAPAHDHDDGGAASPGHDDHRGAGAGKRGDLGRQQRIRRGYLLRLVLPGRWLCQPRSPQGNGVDRDVLEWRLGRLHGRRLGGRQPRACGRLVACGVFRVGAPQPGRGRGYR